MVSYDRLWETMKRKGISQYRLITHYKVSAGQLGRMKKNMHVSTHTLEVFCNILQCPVEEIMEIILAPSQEEAEKNSAEKNAAGDSVQGNSAEDSAQKKAVGKENKKNR